jgi:hypothetical protein
MGIFHVPIEIGDPRGERFESVEALVDTGATFVKVMQICYLSVSRLLTNLT